MFADNLFDFEAAVCTLIERRLYSAAGELVHTVSDGRLPDMARLDDVIAALCEDIVALETGHLVAAPWLESNDVQSHAAIATTLASKEHFVADRRAYLARLERRGSAAPPPPPVHYAVMTPVAQAWALLGGLLARYDSVAMGFRVRYAVPVWGV